MTSEPPPGAGEERERQRLKALSRRMRETIDEGNASLAARFRKVAELQRSDRPPTPPPRLSETPEEERARVKRLSKKFQEEFSKISRGRADPWDHGPSNPDDTVRGIRRQLDRTRRGRAPGRSR